MRDDDREYHLERAREELDHAYRAARDDVAEAHLKLSSLHMQRLCVFEVAGDSDRDRHP